MADPEMLALGVEEEFQLVEANTGSLVSGFERLMDSATPHIHNHVKSEFLQCVAECVTGICPTIAWVRDETAMLRATAATMARTRGWALIAGGTHPFGRWQDQRRSPGERYKGLEERLQDVARSILIYGLHVHVNIPDPELRVQVMNQARSFLPHILALSANSPLWMGHKTGFMSYRTVVWAPFPMSGIPDPFPDYAAYLRFRHLFERVHSLDDTRRVWWDLRLHDKYPTLEFRVADMPMSHADSIAIVAFIQGLCKVLIDRTQSGHPLPVHPTAYISENRWRAALGGPRGKLVDFDKERERPARTMLKESLDLVADAMIELGAEEELLHLREMIHPRARCGAERQLAVYHQDGAQGVAHMLMRETMAGIDLRRALPLAELETVAAAQPQVRLRMDENM
jgi:glutamate---cysteine ligase / carboxylate-amine ligase